MKAYIITIGNELLIGDTVNTNAAWLGTFLMQHNIDPVKSVTIGDDADDITGSLNEGLDKAELVILTGGLGPTHDDITKKTLAAFFNVGMTEHAGTRDFIRKVFEKRGIPVTKSNLEQAQVPENCEVLFNKNGTAPGMWFTKNGKIIVCVPGVPFEMKYLMREEVLPRLRDFAGIQGYVYRHYFQTSGIGESTLSDLVIGDVNGFTKNGTSLAYLPHVHGVSLRLSVWGDDEPAAKNKADALIRHIRDKAGEYIFSEEKDVSLPETVGIMLKQAGKNLAVAESCTGGLIGSKITDIPGCSEWFAGGIIAYSNESKINQLGVESSTIETFGAVSPQTASEMARGAAEKFGADIGISVTGIAGPGGGSKDKPVGLVYFGYKDAEHHFTVRAQFFKDRLINKERSALVALDIVRRILSGSKSLPYDLKANRIS